ncbi:MAG: hypothetical protein AN483_07050 [Aphanizomenon flos-aquae MDT14a]|jgi:hypothetical protein|nr:MAG: hypothetical protein AN483_07050 [Aphanizomenon flos-aquae MDT14a]
MPKKIVRVPITGFVKIAVDASSIKAAESLAHSLVTTSLSPRDGVTDLNTLLTAEDFCLTTYSSADSAFVDEDYIDF